MPIEHVDRKNKQILSVGVPVFARKLKVLLRFALNILFFILAALFLMLVTLLRPLYLVRWNPLISNRIGHFAGSTELYCCERDSGINIPDRPYIDIFYYGSSIVCNEQLATMWRRQIIIAPYYISIILSRATRLLNIIGLFLPNFQMHIVGNNFKNDRVKAQPNGTDRDVQGLREKSKIHLHFTAEEKSEAQAGLRDMGIGKETPFVCLMARDSAYLKNNFPAQDWYHHNYRDCNIKNYILAATELTARGYFVVRMGAEVLEAMDIDNPQVIDYAHNGHRTELLDIYLGANCSFFLNGMSGFGMIPNVFRRPTLDTNYVPVEYLNSFNSKSIITFKKHWLKDDHRFMTFREILESGAGRYVLTQDFDKHGIELIENTPEEIRDGVIEMDERLKGTWQTTEEDEELQRRFWDILPKSEINVIFHSRIGADFLRKNQELLK